MAEEGSMICPASLVRLYGILFDGGGDLSNWLSFFAEFTFGLLAFVLYILEKRKGNTPSKM